VAYSSVDHMGFCTLGPSSALNPAGISGLDPAADQPRHFDGMLFLIVGVVYGAGTRAKSRSTPACTA